MDWLLATPQLYSAFSSLGCLEGDTYVVNPNALGKFLKWLFITLIYFI